MPSFAGGCVPKRDRLAAKAGPAKVRSRVIEKPDQTIAQALQTRVREKLMGRLLKDEKKLYDLLWQLLDDAEGQGRDASERVKLLTAVLGKVLPEQREIASQEANTQTPVLIQINGLDARQPGAVTAARVPPKQLNAPG